MLSVPLLRLNPFTTGLFLFSLDRLCKYAALHHWAEPWLVGEWLFGWNPFLNPGVAFGLPLPLFISTAISLPIIGLIGYLLVVSFRADNSTNDRLYRHGLVLIGMGALSNAIDRIAFDHTVDYFQILTGVINIADIMIVAGVFLYLRSQKHDAGAPNAA